FVFLVLAGAAIIAAACVLCGPLLLGRAAPGPSGPPPRATVNLELYRSLVEHLPTPLCVSDPWGRVLLANAAMCELWGVGPEACIGRPAPYLAPQQAAAPDQDGGRGTPAPLDGRSLEDVQTYRKPDGSLHRHRLTHTPLLDASGQVRAILCSVQPLQPESPAESAAAAIRMDMVEDLTVGNSGPLDAGRGLEVLEAVLDAMPLAICLKDRNARIFMANRHMRARWGFADKDNLAEQSVRRMSRAPLAEQEEIQRTDAEVLSTGKTVEFETIREINSGPRRVRVIKVPLWGRDGSVSGLIMISEDVTQQRAAVQAVKESQALLQLVFDSMPHHVFLKDREGRLVMSNRAMQEAWGELGATLNGRVVQDMTLAGPVDPHTRAEILRTDAQVFETGQPVVRDLVRVLKNGPRTMRAIKVPVRDASGVVTRILVVSEDVTEHLAAEEALKSSQALLQLVFDSMPINVFLKDREGRVLMANRAMRGRWASLVGNLIGRKIQDLSPVGEIPPAERERILATDAQVLRTGLPVEYESERQMFNGLRRLRQIKVPVRDSGGHITSMLVVVEDVTELRHREEELRQGRRLLHAVFDTIPHYVWVKDAQRRYVMINRALAQAFGCEPENAVGKTTLFPAPQDHFDTAERDDRTVLDLGEVSDRMMQRPLPGGRVRHFRVIKTPLRNDEGQVTGVVGMAEDVTDRVLAEQRKAELELRLQRAQKMETIGQLAAGIAHDFNNLLTPILGHAQFLLLDTPPGMPSHNALQTIAQAAERAGEMTRRLLAFGRQQSLDMHTVSLNDQLSGILPMLTRLVGPRVRFETDFRSQPSLIRADTAQLHQVLLNLAVNARDAMPEGGRILVSTSDEVLEEAYAAENPDVVPGAYVLLTFADSGQGMSAEVLQHLFEPFFTTKEPGKGTGLGLSIIYGVVKQHQGHIRVYSEVGIGTSFKIYLPAVRSEDKSTRPREAISSLPRGTENVLVVDDDSSTRNLVANVLSSQGYSVRTAASP
ncbi:MAG TPA: PAS domain-containing protein, partial [bacterium]|nr:PAS domain-containing protein [bacterium]